MPWNTLDSYGDGDGSFLDEGEQPQSTDSSYARVVEGNQNTTVKEGKPCQPMSKE